jgi:hypothetical protein
VEEVVIEELVGDDGDDEMADEDKADDDKADDDVVGETRVESVVCTTGGALEVVGDKFDADPGATGLDATPAVEPLVQAVARRRPAVATAAQRDQRK